MSTWCRFCRSKRDRREAIPGHSICWECMFLFEDFLDWLHTRAG